MLVDAASPLDAARDDSGVLVDAGSQDAGEPDSGSSPEDAGMAADAMADGDASDAADAPSRLSCPVLIVGGSASGVAAAIAATTFGAQTCLIEQGQRLGGQLWIVPELDENPPPGVPIGMPWSDSYRALRIGIQDHYRNTYGLRDEATCSDLRDWFDPGLCTCCGLCYEPEVALQQIEALVAPMVEGGLLTVLRGTTVIAVTLLDGVVTGVSASGADGSELAIDATVTIDATEAGDVIPLTGASWRAGAESRNETGEEHSRDVAVPLCVQPMTFPIFVENGAEDEDHRIEMPQGYDPSLYSQQRWSPEGNIGPARLVVSDSVDACGNAWPQTELNWRRMRSTARLLGVATETSQINTANDFNHGCVGGTPEGCDILWSSPEDRALVLERGRDFALGYLYYLQNDVPRDDGLGNGYPNLRPAAEVTGTADGVADAPYVRESRRIRALVTVVEEDLSQAQRRRVDPAAQRARPFADSIGIGQYGMDLHICAAGDPFSTELDRTLPFQIPLGALIPEQTEGLLAAGKNIGTTHLTNGTYRLHPVEWHIGLGAGALAATAVQEGVAPREVYEDIVELRRLQDRVVRRLGSPIYWYSDVFADQPALFAATQLVAVEDIMTGLPGDLTFEPTRPIERWVMAIILVRLVGGSAESRECPPELFSDVPCEAGWRGWVEGLVSAELVPAGGSFRPDDVATRRELIELVVRAIGLEERFPVEPTFADVPADDPSFGAIEAAAEAELLRDDPEGSEFFPDAEATRGTAALWTYGALRIWFGLD